MQLADLLNKISADLAADSSAALAVDTELLMSGIIDSLGVVTLVSWLEEQANIEIDPGDVIIENFETPAAILSFVDTLTGQGTA